MRWIEAFFPLSHGIPRVDDRRIISGIVYVIKHGLMRRDAPKGYGPHKTIYNRFVRWSRLGVFNRIFAELAGAAGSPDRIMIDATHLKAHRTVSHCLITEVTKRLSLPHVECYRGRTKTYAERPSERGVRYEIANDACRTG